MDRISPHLHTCDDSDAGVPSSLTPELLIAKSAVDIPSDAALLLKNLRFLDLDLLPDWPDITTRTFRAVKDAHLTQKERVRCAEWVFFKLFEIWDTGEAHVKLSPYFPALEPRQSIKLRNALYQSLSHLKVTGVLGRECILRKSTLDECKGSKFEELLFVFSTIVLQKHLRTKTRKGNIVALAQDSAVASAPDDLDLESLESLVWVHKRNLDRALFHRRDFRTKAQFLEERLGQSLAGLDVKANVIDDDLSGYEDLFKKTNTDVEKMNSELREENVDNEWFDMIINGESEQDQDPFIEDSFSNIWSKVTQGESLVYSERPKTMLEDLEYRIQEQNKRLVRWRSFQQTVSKRNEELYIESPAKSPLKAPVRSPLKSPRKAPPSTPMKTPRVPARHVVSKSPDTPTARLVRGSPDTELSVIFRTPTRPFSRPFVVDTNDNLSPTKNPDFLIPEPTEVLAKPAAQSIAFPASQMAGSSTMHDLGFHTSSIGHESSLYTPNNTLSVTYEFQNSSPYSPSSSSETNQAESAAAIHHRDISRPNFTTSTLTERTLATLSRTPRNTQPPPNDVQSTDCVGPRVDTGSGDMLEPSTTVNDGLDREMAFRTRSKLRMS